MELLKSFQLLVALISMMMNVMIVSSLTTKEVEQELEIGNRLLATGQLADALMHFHNAIDGDPTNYMSFYKRATVLLAMGRFRSALHDLNKVIELKPDFMSARMQRANVLTKQGLFEEATKDYNKIIADSNGAEARERLDRIYTIMSDLDNAKRAMDNHDFGAAIEVYTQVLEHCPWSTEIHELRSECYLKLGDISKAINDIDFLAKLIPDNTDAYYRLSELHYIMGDAEYALNKIRECLKLDSEHKKCSDKYKELRKLTKIIERMRKGLEENRFNECIDSAGQLIKFDANAHTFISKGNSYICTCSTKAKDTKLSIESCGKVISQNPNDADALYNRAQSHIADEKLDAAKSDCQKANEIENSQRTMECLERINKLIKQASKKDYYKILGVKRNADKAAIMKAYRKLAIQWHPDKFPDGPEKDEAQKKFIDLAAAKEVLSDPEKRQRFDNGEDPLDPEEQAQHGHHGFNPFGHGHGFNPFGNGNFQFKFKFN